MDRKLDLKKGQKVVVILYGSNATRGINMSLENIDNWCFDGEITSVGRKYVKAKFKGYIEETFVIENDYEQKYKYGCPDYKIYLTKKEVYEKRKNKELYDKIRRLFQEYYNNKGYTNEQLENVFKILNADEE